MGSTSYLVCGVNYPSCRFSVTYEKLDEMTTKDATVGGDPHAHLHDGSAGLYLGIVCISFVR